MYFKRLSMFTFPPLFPPFPPSPPPSIFLMGPNCNYSKDMWGQRMNGTPIWIPHFHNNMFPDVYCFAMPHIIMLVVGSLIAILSIVISYLMVRNGGKLVFFDLCFTDRVVLKGLNRMYGESCNGRPTLY